MSFSQRTAMLGAIVAVHGAAVYAMSGGLALRTRESVVPPIQTEILLEIPRPLMQRPPLLAPEMKRLRIDIPPPDIEIRIPVDTTHAITGGIAGAATMESNARPPPSGPALKTAVRYIIHARVGEDFPNPDAFYPSAAIRREEQGLASVQVCIGPDGALVEEPWVVKPSGSARLDEAALKLARSGHYLPGSVDGQPITDCLQLPIRFRVKT